MVRPRNFFQTKFSRKCIGWIKFSTPNLESALNSASDDMLEDIVRQRIGQFSICFNIHAYAIYISYDFIKKSLANHIFHHIIGRRIWCWFRISSQKFNSTHAFSRKMCLKKIAWADHKNFAWNEFVVKFCVEICVYCMPMTHAWLINKKLRKISDDS